MDGQSMGRDLDTDPLVGVITLREVRLNVYGYDHLGVYRGIERYHHGSWDGHLRRLYLVTAFSQDGASFEGHMRGHDYADVRKRLMQLFIEATVVRAKMLKPAKGPWPPSVVSRWSFQ